jgi:hypothetical protein
MTSINAPTNGAQEPVIINANALSHSLRHKPESIREQAAASLMSGEIGVTGLNRMQAAKLCHVPYAKLAKKPASPLSTLMICSWWAQADLAARAALVSELGVASVWDAIEATIT